MTLKRSTRGRSPTDAEKQARQDELLRLYERHGKPLEAEHWGEFLAVSSSGETLLAATLYEVLKHGFEQFGSGNVIFKVGKRVVGKIR